MKQAWYHYTKWEDYQARMYDEVKEGREERVQKAVYLLTNLELLYVYMTKVTEQWVYATEQNLTNSSINHQAFLGQTACCLYAGVKEDETREAWGRLKNTQRYEANKVADRVYYEWQRKYDRKTNPFYQMSLFNN